jgi:hypothetical protein
MLIIDKPPRRSDNNPATVLESDDSKIVKPLTAHCKT